MDELNTIFEAEPDIVTDFCDFKTPDRPIKINAGSPNILNRPIRKTKTPKKPQATPKKDARGRTPSGQILSNDYDGIRKFFQQASPTLETYFKKRKIDESNSNANKLKINEMNMPEENQSTVHMLCKQSQVQSVQGEDKHEQGAEHDQTGHDQESQGAIAGEVSNEEETEKDERGVQNTYKDVVEENHQMVVDADTEGNTSIPQAMDTLAVMRMFHEIRGEMKTINEKVALFEKDKEESEKDDQLQTAYNNMSLNYSTLKREMEIMKRRNMLLSGQVCKMTQMMKELQRKMEKMEINAGKRMVVLSGFYGSSKKHICLQQLDEFFEKQMKIDVFVEDFFTMGEFQPPNLVITFQSMEDKRLLFRHIDRIKNITNKDGKKLYFKDFLPAQINENQRREQDIFWNNKRKPPAEKISDMEMTKKGLLINKMPYQKKVKAPDPCVILKMPIKEIEETLKYPVIKASKSVKNMDDSFIGYTLATNNHEAVQKAYLKIKLHHPSARHIMCAYNLPGLPDHEMKDYQDDEEVGGGRALLELLVNNNIECRAVFVARYCKEEKLGASRFLSIQMAAIHAINNDAENPFTRTLQKVDVESSETKIRGDQAQNRGQYVRGVTSYSGRCTSTQGRRNNGPNNQRKKDDKKMEFHPISEEEVKEKERHKEEKKSNGDAISNNRGGGYEKDWPKVSGSLNPWSNIESMERVGTEDVN